MRAYVSEGNTSSPRTIVVISEFFGSNIFVLYGWYGGSYALSLYDINPCIRLRRILVKITIWDLKTSVWLYSLQWNTKIWEHWDERKEIHSSTFVTLLTFKILVYSLINNNSMDIFEISSSISFLQIILDE